jgi:hypothetical protein
MPRINRRDIDRKTNKPSPFRTESPLPDEILNRSMQIRRDDDVIRTTQRTVYDIDYAIKWFIENEIRPQIESDKKLIAVPVIFANGEKWDNVRRLGYLRDEKGMLQSPLIMLKRNTVAEKDTQRTLDVNRNYPGNYFVHKSKYNSRNSYEDELIPIPLPNSQANSEKIYVVDIPKYVTLEYDMMVWCDFTTQLNSLVDQILPYGRFSWGNEGNKFPTAIGSINFETVNTVGEDRLVRATIPLTVQGTLLSAQEARKSTLQKMYSVKKLTFEQVIDVDVDVFSTTSVPTQLLQAQNVLVSGGSVVVSGGGTTATIDLATMTYLTNLSDKVATYVSTTTISISSLAATNPVTLAAATKNEFNVYINGQYIDKMAYTWTPSSTINQTIVFDTSILGYGIEVNDVIVINGRWA